MQRSKQAASRLVSDETWSRLDPRVGALTRGQRRRAYLGSVLFVLLIALCAGVWWSGLAGPRLAFDDSHYARDIDGRVHTFSVTLGLQNKGRLTEQITGLGRSGPGLRLVRVEGLPIELPPSSSVEVRLSYQVTDCGGVQPGRWPIPMSTRRPGPDRSVDVQPQQMTTLSRDDGREEPWQQALAADACSAKPAGGSDDGSQRSV